MGRLDVSARPAVRACMRRPALTFTLLALAIAGLTLSIYGGAGSAAFINWDDDVYVVNNPYVQGGFSVAGWRRAWAIGTPPYYIPVTWLSFMLNAEFAGSDAGGYHLTNVLLHAANVVLLFYLFRRMTGETTRSLLVATSFAVHPLHVGAVMWVAQRKEVLSAFFGLAALVCYLGYVQRRQQAGRAAATGRCYYLATMLALLLSLLSKPMWLTMPALLLLLDAWPLQRWGLGWRVLVTEKVPLAALCVVVFALNVAIFDWGGPQLAKSIDVTPFAAGWGTIPISYGVFLWKTVVPYPLAVPYTNFEQPPTLAAAALAIGVLVALTVAAAHARRRMPWILCGWLWFLIAAATVLFSFGSGKVTPLADHWTYVPHIGLFAAVAWSLPLGRAANRTTRGTTGIVCLVALVAFGVTAHRQTRYWHDAPSLWAHSIAVTERNHVAHWLWGSHQWEAGDHAGGERLMREAQRLNRGEAFYVQRLGNMLLAAGREQEAVVEYDRLRQAPLAAPGVLTAAGISVLRTRGPADAERFLRLAADLAATSVGGDPTTALVYLWITFVALGRDEEAEDVSRRILSLQGGERAAFCREVTGLVRQLGDIDAAWLRFAPPVDAHCVAGGGR